MRSCLVEKAAALRVTPRTTGTRPRASRQQARRRHHFHRTTPRRPAHRRAHPPLRCARRACCL